MEGYILYSLGELQNFGKAANQEKQLIQLTWKGAYQGSAHRDLAQQEI